MADDQRPESFDDVEPQSLPESLDPAGELLDDYESSQNWGTDLGDSYQLVDPDAEEIAFADEELDSTPFKADPEDAHVDDPEQLAAAEALAARARSSRPVRRTKADQDATAPRLVPVDDATAEARAQAEADAAAARAANQRSASPRPASARPVKRTGGATAAPAATPPQDEPARTVEPVAARRPVRREQPASTELESTAPGRRRSPATEQPHRRTTPAMFVNQSVGELRKVIWPTADQLRQYFVVVLVFVLFIIAYVGLLDFGFGWVLLRLLGE